MKSEGDSHGSCLCALQSRTERDQSHTYRTSARGTGESHQVSPQLRVGGGVLGVKRWCYPRSGLIQRMPSKRAKSLSKEHMPVPYSMARAAR